MEPTKLSFYEELEQDIKNAYEKATDEDEAKSLAAKFLLAQLDAGRELANLDLDARIKKSGLKAEKAKLYLQTAKAGDKKPSDVLIAAVIDSDTAILADQANFDRAEVERQLIENYLQVFREAHLFFRSASKGRFD